MQTIVCPRCRKARHPDEFPGNGVCIECYSYQVGNEGMSYADLYIKAQQSRWMRWHDNRARRGNYSPIDAKRLGDRLERATARGVNILSKFKPKPPRVPMEPLTGVCEACLEEKEDIDSYAAPNGAVRVLCTACAASAEKA